MKKFIVACLMLLCATARAELLRVDANSFVSSHHLEIAATPEVVWRALTQGLPNWWDAAHSYSGDAANFRLDARAGGCFCETWEDGSVEHMHIVFVRNNMELRMSGGLGPLQAMGVAGVMSFSLSSTKAGTTLDYQYTVNGAGGEALANAVDRVQLGQLLRLKRYVEEG